ncbi:MAG TPA: methyltransferase, FxLD system [Mycobacteriales bacterium]|nr:methyltransferase, FxLD system [Mycobacteriales bacterium]
MTSEATRRERLVAHLVEAGRIRSDRVAAAMRAVPRHRFLPGVDPAVAYADEAVPTRWSADGRPTSSSSQPSIVAAMLEQLDVRPGHRVLEIGSGTGWNAALLAHLVGPGGAVTTIDIEPEVAAQARRNLGPVPVEVVCGDGAAGRPEAAPFDRIILTAAARDLAPAWWDQLGPRGRLVLPLSLRGPQRSVAFERAGDHLVSVSVVDCGFMPLQGLLAGVDPVRPLGRPGLFLRLEDPRPLDTAALLAALEHDPGPVTPVPLTQRDGLGGLRLWLALHDPDAGDLHAVTDTRPAPTPVLVGTDSLAVLLPQDRAMAVQGHGPDRKALAERLLAHVDDWIAAGRPASAGLRIEAYRKDGPATVPPPTLDLPNTRFAVYLGS